jgi:hypothetical protein
MKYRDFSLFFCISAVRVFVGKQKKNTTVMQIFLEGTSMGWLRKIIMSILLN